MTALVSFVSAAEINIHMSHKATHYFEDTVKIDFDLKMQIAPQGFTSTLIRRLLLKTTIHSFHMPPMVSSITFLSCAFGISVWLGLFIRSSLFFFGPIIRASNHQRWRHPTTFDDLLSMLAPSMQTRCKMELSPRRAIGACG